MASLTNAGAFGRRRWGIWALLRHGAERAAAAKAATVNAATVNAATERSAPVRTRRFYPPQRDRSLEKSAMAREMYRL